MSAVFAMRAMEHGENDVDATANRGGRLGHLQRPDGSALLHITGGNRCRLLCAEHPAPVFVDADRHRLKAVAIEVFEDGCGRDDGDFVFSGSATVDHADTQFHACDNKGVGSHLLRTLSLLTRRHQTVLIK